ncbi:DUF6491 family protein [Dokdonella sp.]|uniref:DUF6491 family protein n=1 Tax=Dokdonella sp. TaxID=2291710 RepID=UPI002606EED5|nr:DUF6491 family protein [Dokdonella sp.]
MKRLAGVVVALLAAGAVVASAADRRIEGQRDIQRYQNAAEGEVQQMALPSLVDWQALDDSSLAVWTANDKPWLVRTQGPCSGLATSESVALTSRDGNVKVGTDYVELGATHCKIESIQPVDYARIVARPHHAMHRMHKAVEKNTGA